MSVCVCVWRIAPTNQQAAWETGFYSWRQKRVSSHSLKLKHCWSLSIRFFKVIYRTLIGGLLPLYRDAISAFYSPSWLGHKTFIEEVLIHCRDAMYSTAPTPADLAIIKSFYYYSSLFLYSKSNGNRTKREIEILLIFHNQPRVTRCMCPSLYLI